MLLTPHSPESAKVEQGVYQICGPGPVCRSQDVQEQIGRVI
jgi:hypothetical protein